MRRKIFEKAKYLLTKIKITSETDYSISFSCNEYHVTAKYQNHRLIWLCDCMAGSNEMLCAHKIACQSFLVHSHTRKTMETSNPSIANSNVGVLDNSGETEPNIGLDHLTEAQKLVLRQMVCFTCQSCKRHEDICGKLEVHRKIRGEHGGKYIPGNTDIICSECHDMRD